MGALSEFAWRVLVVSLPNFLTIFVAIGLFCSLYPLRPGAWRLACGALACLGISCASSLYHTVTIPRAVLLFGDFASAAATIASSPSSSSPASPWRASSLT